MVILTGNVMANVIGRYKPGLEFGIAIFIAAGTAMYDALAARILKIKRLETSAVIY